MINKFLWTICNCSDYCVTINFTCSLDDTIATIIVTLREEQLNMQVNAALREGQLQIKFNDQNYSIFYVKTLYKPTTPTTTMAKTLVPTTMVSTNSTSSENITDENNSIISVVSIAIIAAVALMLLVLMVLLIITLRLCNKRRSKSATKKECKYQITFNAGSECPSTLNSSNGRTFHSSLNTGSHVSDPVDDPLSSHIIQSTDNKHIVMKTHQMNCTSKHLRNIQSGNDQHDIHWEINKTYAILNPHNSASVYKSPATVPKSLINGEAEINLYDDVEGINESRRRATTAGHTHHNVQPRPPTSYSRIQYPHGNCNVSPVNNDTISKTGAIHA